MEDEIHEEIPSLMRKYKDEKIVSEIIYPIIYINHSRQSIPLGYIWVRNKKNLSVKIPSKSWPNFPKKWLPGSRNPTRF
ncbi:PF07614 domain protein [Leptospira interrogans serovar Bataviae str. HAI135]|nr:PF07614 domain protein [Leptospira interrogans serovar Bataviae str. HAI135]